MSKGNQRSNSGIGLLTIPLFLFTLFFVGNIVLGNYVFQRISDDQSQVTQSLSNINSINSLGVELLKAESRQRGLLLNDVPAFAELYDLARAGINDCLATLRESNLTVDQAQRLDTLERLALEKLTEMDNSIKDLRDKAGTENPLPLISARGTSLTSEITALIDEMKIHEHQLLGDRLQRALDSRTTASWLVLTANLLGLIMVFISFVLLKKSRAMDQAYALSLRQANDSLEERVEQRTATLQHFSNELRRSNRELQDFAFIASHDLQEPLRKIRAFGDRLESGYADKLGDRGQDYIRRMQKASERMSALISDLLSFSRITTEQRPFARVDLNTIVGEVKEDLEIAIEETQADITTERLPDIEADYSQIKQLFQNLIGNALKFRKQAVAPVVTIRSRLIQGLGGNLEDAKQWVEITISDNGIGFDSSHAETIFMPFQRLHGRDEFAGTGIGLAVCRRIVERHGGYIGVQSAPGKGSTFTLCLPAAR